METSKNVTVKITSKNHKYANTYGGEIREFDFYTCGTAVNKVADKIMAAWRFDKECAENVKYRF